MYLEEFRTVLMCTQYLGYSESICCRGMTMTTKSSACLQDVNFEWMSSRMKELVISSFNGNMSIGRCLCGC